MVRASITRRQLAPLPPSEIARHASRRVGGFADVHRAAPRIAHDVDARRVWQIALHTLAERAPRVFAVFDDERLLDERTGERRIVDFDGEHVARQRQVVGRGAHVAKAGEVDREA
jgi:hypothetical protein